jgi:hypothetical protein
MMSAKSRYIAQQVKHHLLHIQTGLSNSATGTFQTAQVYHADLMPEEIGKKNKFNSMAICLSVLGDSVLAGTKPAINDLLGADIELQHRDSMQSGSWAAVNLSQMLGAGYLDAPAEYDLVNNVIKFVGKCEVATGSVIEAKVNVECSRLKRFVRVRVRPQFGGTSATTLGIVVSAVLGAPQESPTDNVDVYAA